MPRRQEKPEPVHACGAPEWMVTFSDCMTLLLTFFVLLLSFSSFDDRVFYSLKVVYSDALSSISLIRYRNQDSFIEEVDPIQSPKELDKGSEKQTPADGINDALMKDKPLVDLGRGRVILIPSANIFWGNGKVISSSGRESLSVLASFLAKVSNRVVISEHGPANMQQDYDYGLARAWAVSEHLVQVHGLAKKQFSLSAASTLPPEGLAREEPDSLRTQAERTVEIVLLDRSIHD
ncbi:MAG: flagellar motor protein MotB [Planctomycetota bacterium]|jgi:chemotaxis protein MotB